MMMVTLSRRKVMVVAAVVLSACVLMSSMQPCEAVESELARAKHHTRHHQKHHARHHATHHAKHHAKHHHSQKHSASSAAAAALAHAESAPAGNRIPALLEALAAVKEKTRQLQEHMQQQGHQQTQAHTQQQQQQQQQKQKTAVAVPGVGDDTPTMRNVQNLMETVLQDANDFSNFRQKPDVGANANTGWSKDDLVHQVHSRTQQQIEQDELPRFVEHLLTGQLSEDQQQAQQAQIDAKVKAEREAFMKEEQREKIAENQRIAQAEADEKKRAADPLADAKEEDRQGEVFKSDHQKMIEQALQSATQLADAVAAVNVPRFKELLMSPEERKAEAKKARLEAAREHERLRHTQVVPETEAALKSNEFNRNALLQATENLKNVLNRVDLPQKVWRADVPEVRFQYVKTDEQLAKERAERSKAEAQQRFRETRSQYTNPDNINKFVADIQKEAKEIDDLKDNVRAAMNDASSKFAAKKQ